MSGRPQEPELRGRFEQLKRLDASCAPAFGDVMARARAAAARGSAPVHGRISRVTLRRIGWAGGLAAAATIAALTVIPRARSGEDEFVRAVRAFHSDPALGGWRSPTDGLLDVPGGRLISTIPRVGTAQQ